MNYTVEQVEVVPEGLVRGGKWKELRAMLELMRKNGQPIKIKLPTYGELERARSTVYNWANTHRLWNRVHTTIEGASTLYVYIDPVKGTAPR